jgi:hypothetical protein
MGWTVMGEGVIEFEHNPEKIESFVNELSCTYGLGENNLKIIDNDVHVEMFGNKHLDWTDFETICKKYKDHLVAPVIINEWTESDGGVFYDPQEEEE